MVTSVDRPTRSGCAASSFGSSAMRTGTRCTTLIQLPVAFCGGSSENAPPEPAAMLATTPWYSTWPPYRSVDTVAGWPTWMWRSCGSLKLASIHAPCSGTTASSAAPGATCWPTCTERRATTPSIGACTSLRCVASAACT